MSFPIHSLLISFLPIILRILNTRSQFRIESWIRASDGEKIPHSSLHKSRFPRAFFYKGKEKKIEKNEETIGDILAAETARCPEVPLQLRRNPTNRTR